MERLNCKSSNRGFSLLEVIIAVAILAAGIVVILQAFSFSAQATGLACDIIDAVFLAEDKIQELEFKGKQGLITEGPVRDKSGRFEWEYVIDSESGLSLHKLNFNLSWQRLNRKEELNLNTYLK